MVLLGILASILPLLLKYSLRVHTRHPTVSGMHHAQTDHENHWGGSQTQPQIGSLPEHFRGKIISVPTLNSYPYITEDYRGLQGFFLVCLGFLVLGWLFFLLLHSLKQQPTTAWKSVSLLFLLCLFFTNLSVRKECRIPNWPQPAISASEIKAFHQTLHK